MQAHSLYQVLTPMLGIRVPAAATFLAEPLSKELQAPEPRWPPTPAWHRQTRRSDSSIRSEHVSHGDNKRIKRAMLLSAFVSLRPIPSARPGTSANATKANTLSRPSPHPDLARHNPRQHPLCPTAIHSRLIHHIGPIEWVNH